MIPMASSKFLVESLLLSVSVDSRYTVQTSSTACTVSVLLAVIRLPDHSSRNSPADDSPAIHCLICCSKNTVACNPSSASSTSSISIFSSVSVGKEGRGLVSSMITVFRGWFVAVFSVPVVVARLSLFSSTLDVL